MKVEVIGVTEMFKPDVPWDPEDKLLGCDWDYGDDLVEFAGRACYQSWNRPNPKTATNKGYINHILEVEHLSVLEHANLTFYITGISRSLTHELIRHRHLSPSQLSQRYVDSKTAEMVVPPLYRDDPEAQRLLGDLFARAKWTYDQLVVRGEKKLAAQGVSGTSLRKQAREAARAAMPNATETKIVLTGNARAWRHFIELRANMAADAEIRELALEILQKCKDELPHCFQDLEVEQFTEENK